MRTLPLLLGFVGLLMTASVASAASANLAWADTQLVSGVCVDTGAHCGPYDEAWVSIGPYQIAFVRVCVTSHTSHLLC